LWDHVMKCVDPTNLTVGLQIRRMEIYSIIIIIIF